MSSRDLDQMRARLISLRDQRNRMVHRSSEMERHASGEVEGAKAQLDRLRLELMRAQHELAELKPEVAAFERGQAPTGGEASWQATWREAAARLTQVEQSRAHLEAQVVVAERQLQRALADQERASADEARALARVEQEIAELTVEVGREQAERPPVEAADPKFREILIERLEHLEAERRWIGEEIAQRDERLRRIGAEAAQIRSLLELHTPDWGRAALDSLAPDSPPDRTLPAWKQGVLEILGAASKPLHYREIADQLAATGRSLGGQDPAETLVAAVGRDRDFIRVGRGTYWLRSRQLSPPRLRGASHD